MTTEKSNEVKRHDPEEIMSYLEEWKASGKSQITFSKEKGINYYTLNKWINDEKRKVKKPNGTSKGFTALAVTGVDSSGIFAEIKKEGMTIILHQVVTAEFFRSLLK